jgi:hypothetical protein
MINWPEEAAQRTRSQHKAQHITLHRALDILWADWLRHNGGSNDSLIRGMDDVTVGELIRWSHAQTIDPTEER